MTDREHEKMVADGHEFWLMFSALCQSFLDRAPRHLSAEYEMYLGEKTSIYGRKR